MLAEESRILQVSIFNTLQKNLSRVDSSKVLLDVMTAWSAASRVLPGRRRGPSGSGR
jgi:hypothetical protein